MKKRLSDDPWGQRTMFISVVGLFGILSIGLRVTYISSRYGIVESEIPAINVGVKDPDSTAYQETPRTYINPFTPIIILTHSEFFFGSLESFTTKFSEVRNKFFVKHHDGAPNVAHLIRDMTKWIHQKSSEKKFAAKGIVILMPDHNIPTPIIIQTMANLKKSPFFEQVILAGGIL